jgi:hypothetical protein
VGLVGVLHTWGRNLSYHPHVHYLVPGGGVSGEGTWKPSRKNFLLPVKALSTIVRAKFRDALCKANADCFADIPAAVWQQPWVVHCQPVGRGRHALTYLAPYIFRVAISNNRILRLAHGKVIFRYRTTDTGTLKCCTLPAQEFIRRFLQHVLPRGFVKVRYYGFLSSGLRNRLAVLRQHLESCSTASSPSQVAATQDGQTVDGPGVVPSSHSVVYCPSCGQMMQRGPIIWPNEHSPP